MSYELNQFRPPTMHCVCSSEMCHGAESPKDYKNGHPQCPHEEEAPQSFWNQTEFKFWLLHYHACGLRKVLKVKFYFNLETIKKRIEENLTTWKRCCGA